jgi:hypothetical protein
MDFCATDRVGLYLLGRGLRVVERRLLPPIKPTKMTSDECKCGDTLKNNPMKVCIIFSLLICTPRNDFEGGRKVILQPGKKWGYTINPTLFQGLQKSEFAEPLFCHPQNHF